MIKYVIALAVIAGAFLTGYLYVTKLTEQIATQQAEIATLDVALKVEQEFSRQALTTIQEWEEAAREMNKTIEELARVQRSAASETRRLNDVFSKHNLEALATRKPSLVERAVNRGTADALRLLECATGGGSDCPSGAGETNGGNTAAAGASQDASNSLDNNHSEAAAGG